MKPAVANDAQFREAMASLASNPNFGRFMDLLKEQQQAIIEDLCSNEVIDNDKRTAACIGELRNNRYVLSIYEDFLNQPPPQETGA